MRMLGVRFPPADIYIFIQCHLALRYNVCILFKHTQLKPPNKMIAFVFFYHHTTTSLKFDHHPFGQTCVVMHFINTSELSTNIHISLVW